MPEYVTSRQVDQITAISKLDDVLLLVPCFVSLSPDGEKECSILEHLGQVWFQRRLLRPNRRRAEPTTI